MRAHMPHSPCLLLTLGSLAYTTKEYMEFARIYEREDLQDGDVGEARLREYACGPAGLTWLHSLHLKQPLSH